MIPLVAAALLVASCSSDDLAFADDGTLYLSSFTEPTITAVSPTGEIRKIPVGSA